MRSDSERPNLKSLESVIREFHSRADPLDASGAGENLDRLGAAHAVRIGRTLARKAADALVYFDTETGALAAQLADIKAELAVARSTIRELESSRDKAVR